MTMEPAKRDEFYYNTFPAGFAWSTATASYQIEGAVKEDGRGVSIWDTFSHTEGKTLNGETGDIACDSYHKYQQDVDLMKSLGTTQYRFSIAWPRILPDGCADTLNPKGVAYYNRLIDALLAAGIEPVATLYHWDLPQVLQDKGGWTNPEIADTFLAYARVCFQSFGDRVKSWLTFNEPIVTAWLGYGSGEHAPGIQDPTDSVFKVMHNLLRSHAKAYHLYKSEFKDKQKGMCGIALNSDWSEPKDASNPEHQAASEKCMQCNLGCFANPIFGDGDYPQIFKDQLECIAKTLNLPESPLPVFTAEEIELNKSSADFFGLNHYTSRLVTPAKQPPNAAHYSSLMQINEETDPEWKRGQSEWLYVVPWGLRRLLGWITKTYNKPIIYVMESGVSVGTEELKDVTEDRKDVTEELKDVTEDRKDSTEELKDVTEDRKDSTEELKDVTEDRKDVTEDLNDVMRINYYKVYINEVLKAVRLDGCDVRGYTAWSLMDNFEWSMGYSEQFGLCKVDFNDPKLPRTPKKSFYFYSQVIKDNGFPKKE